MLSRNMSSGDSHDESSLLETTGAPEVLKYGELPTPQPKQGEVLVRVQAAALNPIDI